ncbi:baseplate multidomain protein megatron, partial [Tepidamorphus gemmatus]|uniref:baseplate multidomain protein megatron n=1 Tax=Tepidamorphus gemmatus TaxID=747076 RepID=UPI001A9E20F6
RKPKVESRNKYTVYYGHPYPWVVAGLDRLTADLVSEVAPGVPAYGGSPNDASVIACIRELKARGFRVLLYPFVMMDVPAGNALPNPWSDNAAATGQPAYPWRGRITCSPAPGFAGSPDKTGAAASQVAAFMGSATAAHFAASSGVTVTYSGPDEWRYRRFILHMAKLAQLAGGVDAFTIGSEMVGMTTVRSSASAYPFVSELIDLAGEVRSILGTGTRLGYAADWSEYHSHRPADGSGDVFFHLDPLWADDGIDFIGIDNYLPLADWRDGSDHLDYSPTGPTTVHDLDYLKANVEGGEYYDWFYASAADRDSQTRTPITDGAHGKPWVFRNKDIRSWWQNPHVNRPGGVEAASPTAWVPEGKPIWFTELGCPAVDKGANQPNVFFDPKSSESFLPHFSSGARDDAMQRAFLQAALEYWADDANNPLSGVYPGRMIDTSWTAIWAWDARPAPSFPQDEATWADAANFELGHWISGRLGAAPARETIATILTDHGFADHAIDPMPGVVDAVVIDRILSPRGVLEAILPAFSAYAVESGGVVRFRSRLGEPVVRDLGLHDLAETAAGAGSAAGSDEAGAFAVRTFDEAAARPDVVRVAYGDPAGDDQPASAEAMRPGRFGTGMSATGRAGRVVQVALPVVMPASRAGAIAEMLLNDAWAARETVEFALPPSLLDLDPGDVVRLEGAGADTWRIAEIADGQARRVRAARTEASLYAAAVMPRRPRPPAPVPATGLPEAVLLDGPLLKDGDSADAGYIAAYLSPWPGGVAFWRSPTQSGFVLDTTVPIAARMGELAFDVWSGPLWRWDRGNELWIDLAAGTLASAEEIQVLGGANALAIENADGEWEIVQFATATLMAPGRYRLTNLLRGQRGSAHAMRDPVAADARVLVLDAAVRQPALSADEVGLPFVWRVGPANADVADPSYLETTFTMTGRGRRPLAPVHLRGRRDHATGDWTLSWIRQTRIGGDSWDQTEVPLGEASEAYRLEILDPGDDSVVRTLDLASPSYLYTAAQQTADFGTPIWNVKIRVAQMSATYGAGMPATALTWDH